MSTLNTQIKEVLIKALELEDITPEDIEDDAPLFGQNKEGRGLGLDSIDALELGIAIKDNFGVSFSTVNEETRKHFASIDALAAYISANKKD
ncbi:MAG: phosphopantetheine-binding protein [Hallerella sp.]|mgnify:FL=1|jgi:acyl carrier protein|nr:acyl carrier protein [Fibrobacter sp.]MDY6284416.1 phosphopantetheine-binding protein [Fibrobacter sp.]MDY6369114.1 phosphopantetheine-binding protein [Fibrobacter sp.]MDY6390807.1 phosphopantetheine-binding protein [Fibrobacter sp.]MEE3340702.1 phosphopantetheine-binding protein [Hallerella sp.]